MLATVHYFINLLNCHRFPGFPLFLLALALLFMFFLSVCAAMEILKVLKSYTAHGPTDLEVIYTTNIAQVEETFENLKSKLWKMDEKDEFMGLDFEYTNADAESQEVAVIQLCVNQTVLVWQLVRYD